MRGTKIINDWVDVPIKKDTISDWEDVPLQDTGKSEPKSEIPTVKLPDQSLVDINPTERPADKAVSEEKPIAGHRDYFTKLPSEVASKQNYTTIERALIKGTIEQFDTNPNLQTPQAREKYYLSLNKKGYDTRKLIDAVNLEKEYQDSAVVAPAQAMEHGVGELKEGLQAMTPQGAIFTFSEAKAKGESNIEAIASTTLKPVGKFISAVFGLAGGTPQGASFYATSKELEKKAPVLSKVINAELMPASSSLDQDAPEYQKTLATIADAAWGALIFGSLHGGKEKFTPEHAKEAAERAKRMTPDQQAQLSYALENPEIGKDVYQKIELENDLKDIHPESPAAPIIANKIGELNDKIAETTATTDLAKHEENVVNQTIEKLEADKVGKSELTVQAIDENINNLKQIQNEKVSQADAQETGKEKAESETIPKLKEEIASLNYFADTKNFKRTPDDLVWVKEQIDEIKNKPIEFINKKISRLENEVRDWESETKQEYQVQKPKIIESKKQEIKEWQDAKNEILKQSETGKEKSVLAEPQSENKVAEAVTPEPLTEKKSITLYRGKGGKKNINGEKLTVHPDVKGTFYYEDKDMANHFSRGEGVEEVTANGTTETVEAPPDTPISKLMEVETKLINDSKADIVYLKTIDARGMETQVIVKNPDALKNGKETPKAEKPTKESNPEGFAEAQKIADEHGFEHPAKLINTVNKELGTDYKTAQEVPEKTLTALGKVKADAKKAEAEILNKKQATPEPAKETPKPEIKQDKPQEPKAEDKKPEAPIEQKIEEAKQLTGKDRIAKGLEDLGESLGFTKMAEGGKRPDALKALTEIGKGLIEEGLATAENVWEKVKEYVKDKFNQELPDTYKEDLKAELGKIYTGETKYDNPEMTKMANAVNDAFVEGKFGTEALDNVIKKLQDTDLTKIYNTLKEKIQKGLVDVKKVRERVMRDLHGSELDQAAILYDAAELKGKESNLIKEINSTTDATEKIKLQDDLIQVQNDLMDNALANRAIGRSASSIFRLRQVWVDKSANLSDFMEEFKASKGLDKLTPEQEKQVRDQYTKIKELEGKIKELQEQDKKKHEENVKLAKENETLKNLNQQAKEQKKKERGVKADVAIKNSNDRIAKSKDALRKLRNQANDATKVIPEVAFHISKIAAEKVYQGAVKLDEIARNVLDEIKDIFPEFTEDDVKKHLAYSKESKPRTEQSKILSTVKKTAKIEGEIEKGQKVYSTTEEVPYEKSQELKDAEKEYAKARLKWDSERRQDLMANKPFEQQLADKIVRWQRFAVLSYPSTIVKLMAVVGHGLILKPIKFATQALTYGITKAISPELAKKQSLFGKPRLKALAKYYSEFFKNFSAENLKEQFTGVDAREAQYGKPFIYDEWKASKGWLEIPGRSHGYIKSFIKNPEFEYAMETLTQNYFERASEINKELQNEYLKPEGKAKLQEEYDNYDVTNPDVQERMGKLSLEHGKWSILMNENKAADRFRQWTDNNGLTGALLRTELPILKIPLNYIGRHFATKWGLLQALTGRKGVFKLGASNEFPGIIELMYKGTKDLTPEQADILGRTITQGSIGAAFFTLGYLLKNQIKNNDDGSKEIFGHHISKNLTHVPEYESIFSGAQTAQEHKEGELDFIKNFVQSDIDVIKKSPFINLLSYGFIPNVAEILTNKNLEHDKKYDKLVDAVAKKLADVSEPGFMKQTAESIDAKEGSRKAANLGLGEKTERKPEGNNWERFMQQFEMGIPGLRQNVPLKKTKGGKSPSTGLQGAQKMSGATKLQGAQGLKK